MSRKSRASSCPSQAKLLHGRGDLCGKRAAFHVKLPQPCPLALRAESPFDRIGLDLRMGSVPARLVVSEVDRNPRRKTPVARWNTHEERNANRSAEEQHASLALLPGDRIAAINEVNGETGMLGALLEAMGTCDPKEVSLAISRDISDVMTPSPKPRLPRLPVIPSPPRTPGKIGFDAASSRTSSASSAVSSRSRSRVGSRCGNSWWQPSSAPCINATPAQVGRVALAF